MYTREVKNYLDYATNTCLMPIRTSAEWKKARGNVYTADCRRMISTSWVAVYYLYMSVLSVAMMVPRGRVLRGFSRLWLALGCCTAPDLRSFKWPPSADYGTRAEVPALLAVRSAEAS